jgi:hypothetical protein
VCPSGKVFQGITEAAFYLAMKRACTTAKIPHYSPHDLRHRRITVWHQSRVVARELAERAGHSRPLMSLDVYSDVNAAGRGSGRAVQVDPGTARGIGSRRVADFLVCPRCGEHLDEVAPVPGTEPRIPAVVKRIEPVGGSATFPVFVYCPHCGAVLGVLPEE